MTDALAQFLRDRYDEEAAEAEAAEKRTTTTRRRIQGEWVEDTVQPPEWRRSVWSPARVLREVEAKRRIVDDYHYESTLPDGTALNECGTCGAANDPWPCPTLRLLALPYSDHPNYREDWRP